MTVRTAEHNEACSRIECLIIDSSGMILKIDYIFAVLNEERNAVVESFVSGCKYNRSAGNVGTKRVSVDHIFAVKRSNEILTIPTKMINKKLIILANGGWDTDFSSLKRIPGHVAGKRGSVTFIRILPVYWIYFVQMNF